MQGVGPQLCRVMGHVLEAVRIEKSHPRLRVQFLHLHGAVVIEGGIDDLPLHPHFQFQTVQPLFDLRIKNDSCLDLHVDLQSGRLQKLIDLRQGGNRSVRVFRMGPVEFHFLQFGKSVVHHSSVAAAGPVDGLVMDHHQFSVLRHLYIQLHAVRLLLHGKLKCLQCVFRRVRACAPVRPYLCFHGFSPFVAQNVGTPYSSSFPYPFVS